MFKGLVRHSEKHFTMKLARTRRGRKNIAGAIGGVLTVMGIGLVPAAVGVTWDSGGASPTSPHDGSGNWDFTTIDWSNGSTDTAWPNGSQAIFGAGTGAAGTINLLSSVNVTGLVFNMPGSGNYNISASGASITFNTTTPLITVASGVSPIIGTTLNSSHGLLLLGGGTLNLTGTNTLTGTTNVSSGTLNITGASALGSTSLLVGSGAKFLDNTSLYLNGNATNSGMFNIGNGSTFAMNSSGYTFNQAAGTLNINGSFVSPGNFADNGGAINGQVLLSGSGAGFSIGASNASGNFLFNGSSPSSMLTASNIPSGVMITVHPTSGSGYMYTYSPVINYGTLSLISAPNGSLNFQTTVLTNNGVYNISADTPLTSTESLGGSLINNTAGVVNLNASVSDINSYTVINSGTFNIASGTTFAMNTSSTAFNQAAGTLNINGSFQTAGNFNYNGGVINGLVVFNGSGSQLSINDPTGAGNFLFNGSFSTPTLYASNIPSGVSITVHANAGSSTLSTSGSIPIINNGTLSLISSPGYTVGFASSMLTNNGVYSISADTPLTSTESLGGSLINNTAGIVNLNASVSDINSYTVINSGTFNIASGTTFAMNTSSTAFNQAAGTLNINGSFQTAGNFNYNGGVINGLVVFNGSGSQLSINDSTGAGNFLFNGSFSTPTLYASNIPSGVSITVHANAGSSTLSTSGSIPIINNGTLSLISSPGYTVGFASSLLTNNGVYNISADTPLTSTESLGGSIINNTAGVVNLNASVSDINSYTVINSGTFNIGTGTTFAMNTSSTVFNQAAGTLNINGSFQTAGNFNYNGGVINGLVVFNGSGSQLSINDSTGAGNFLFNGSFSTPTLYASNIPSGVSITVHANAGSSTLSTPGSIPIINNGTLSLVSSPGYTVSFASSLLTNNGVYSISADTPLTSTESLGGSIINNAAGIVNLNASVSDINSYTVINSGTFNIGTGTTFAMNTSSTAFNQAAGTLNINGSFQTAGNFNYNGGVINGLVVFNGSGSQLSINDSTGAGNFLFNGSFSTPTLYASNIPSGVSITVHANAGSSTLSTSGSIPIINNGTLSLISSPGYTVGFASSLLTNNGVYNISADTPLTSTESLGGSIINNTAGVVNLNASVTSSYTINNGGTFNVAGGQTLSFTTAASGFNQTAGVLNAPGNYYVGGNASNTTSYGYLNVSSGLVAVGGTLKVWSTSGAAPLTLNGGSITAGVLDTNGAPANFRWNSGTLTINGSNPVVESASTSPFGPSLTLASGMNFVVSAGNSELVGLNNTGIINQSGGTNTVSAALNFGVNTAGVGSYLLTNTGSLSVTTNENIGVAGQGNFNQSGGTNTVPTLAIANQAGAIGLYTLSSTGSLNATVGEYIGQGGQGTFNQTGGSQTIQEMGLGTTHGGLGTANLQAGTTTVIGGVGVGGTPSAAGGTGVLNISGSESLTIGGALTVFDAPANMMSVSGGSLSATSVTLLGGSTTVSGSGVLTIGAGGLIFTGNDSPVLTTASGKVVLNGDVTFSGSAGTANFNSSGTGTLDLGGTTRNFNIAASAATINMAIAANITDGSLVKTGSGTLLLSGANTFTGSATVSTGILELGNPLALSQASGTIVSAGSTLDLNGQTIGSDPLTLNGTGVAAAGSLINSSVSAASFAGPITLGSGAAFSGFGPITVTGFISGPGGISKIGSNTVTLGGGGNFSGGMSVSAGTLQITAATTFTGGISLLGGTLAVSADNDLGDPANSLTISSGSTFRALASFSSSRPVTASGGSISVDPTFNLTLAGSLGGTGALTKTGAGTLTITSPSSATGAITISAGTLSLAGSGGSLHQVSSIAVTTTGTLELDSTTANEGSTPQNRVADGAVITLGGGTLFMNGSSSSTTTETLGSLNLSAGASTISINANGGPQTSVTFSSLFNRSIGGTLAFNGSDLGNTNQVLFTSGYSSSQHLGGWATVNGTDFAKYSSTGVVPFAAGDYTTDAFTPGADVMLDSSWINSTTVSSVSIATLNLNSTNVGSALTVNLGTQSTLTLSSGGLLKQGLGSAVINNGVLTSTSGELDISVNNGPLTINSQLAGSFVLTERSSNNGTLTLGGTVANTYSGFTLISGNLNLSAGATAIHGNLIVDGGVITSLASNQLDINTNVVLNSGTWNLNGKTETITSFTNNNGTMNFSHGSLTLVGTGGLGGAGSTTLAGGITNLGSTLISPYIAIDGGLNEVEGGGVMEAQILMNFNGASPAVQVDSNASSPGLVILDAGTAARPVNLTFTGTGTASLTSTGSATLPGTLNLSGSTFHVVTVNPSSTLAVSTTVTNGGFELQSGTLQLTAANNYSGGTIIDNTATLIAANTAGLALGLAGSTVMFNGGGTLALRSDSTTQVFPYVGNINASGTSVTVDIDRITRLAGSTTGNFNFSSMTIGTAGAGFSVTGNDGGTLTLGNGSTGAKLAYNASTPSPNVTNFHTTANLTINGPLTQTATGNVAVDITKDQLGTMTFAGPGSNSYGNTTVNAGTLMLSKTGGAIAIPNNLAINGGATVRLTQPSQINPSGSVNINGSTGSSLLDLNGNNNSFGSSGNGGLTFYYGGTLSTGTGIATLGSDVTSIAGASTNIATIQGNLNIGTSGTNPRTFNVGNSSAGTQVNMQISAAISGTIGITKSGAGILYLSGVNTFSGPISINQGILEVNSLVNLGNSANAVTLNGGTLQFFSAFDPAPAGTIVLTAASAVDTQANNVPIAEPITGVGAFTKVGTGTLMLAGSNTFSGGLMIDMGAVQVGTDASLGAAGKAVTLAGGTLASSAPLNPARQIVVNSSGGAIDASKGMVTLSTAPAFTGNLALDGGTLNLNTTNGISSVTGSPTLTIMPDATLLDGGTVDILHGASSTVNILDNAVSYFDVTTGSKMAGTISGAGNTNVSAGTTLGATYIRQDDLFAYGNVNITPQVGAHNGSATVSVIQSLTIAGSTNAWTSKLDLSNNDLILPGASLSTTINQINESFDFGNWNGTGGITSTSAAANAGHLTALGVIQNNELGSPIYTALNPFDSMTPGASDILVKYTYYGDANLDGKVDGSDYSLIDSGFLTHATGWVNGDFNYDGVINGSDYTLIDNAYNTQGARLATEVAGTSAEVAGQVAAVPEPTSSAVLLSTTLISLLSRRRRRAAMCLSSSFP